jgi:hypothetical protein
VLADFDDDDVLDILSGHFGMAQVRLGVGDGTFDEPVELDFADLLAFGVGAGDLDGDGDDDAIVLASEADQVLVWLSNGDGTFGDQVPYDTGAMPKYVLVTDVDGGGLDVLTADDSDGTVSLLSGNGDGTLAAAETIAVGASPSVIGVGDLDGNSFVDLAVGSLSANEVGLVMQDGNGFGSYAAIDRPQPGPRGALFNDWNDDTNLDFFMVGSDNMGQMLFGDGAGAWLADEDADADIGNDPRMAVLATLDGDAVPDIVTANHANGTVSFVLGEKIPGCLDLPEGCSDKLEQHAMCKTGLARPNSVAVGDVDGDGHDDLVIAADGQVGGISVMLANP